jgi:hypothetical protein
LYVPLGKDVYLPGKLPDLSRTINLRLDHQAPFPAVYFTNGLLIPEAYNDPAFQPEAAPAPTLRATNIGYLVATHEFDCKTREQFEEILGWTRGEGGEFSRSALCQWDRELSKFKEYRGYTVVFSGARSLHFHFIFCTEHLIHVPFDATAEERYQADWQAQSALMHNVHDTYWDIALKSLQATVEAPCPSDTKMRSLTQWRRAPWGIRILEKDAPILGLTKGTEVPQPVIREKIRARAPKGSTDYAVAPDFNCSTRSRHHNGKNNKYDSQEMDSSVGQAMLDMVREICLAEWQSEYPKPASIYPQNGEWLINFYNHEGDKKPSTIVHGEYRKLLLAGKHSFSREFYLPDQMTAQELGNHIYMRCGGTLKTKAENFENIVSKHEGKDNSNQAPLLVQKWVNPTINSFSNDVDFTAPREQLIETYQLRFGKIANQIRIFSNPYIIKSVEGLGKTSAHIKLLPYEVLDDAIASLDSIQRFGCFAFRSYEQAMQKAAECQNAGHNAIVIRSFRSIYESVCAEQGMQPLPTYSFQDCSPTGVMAEIEEQQPEVFEQLETVRKSLWKDASFNAGTTILFMTHALAKTWNYGRMTRIWHHPDFDPWNDKCDSLRNEFALGKVIFDELEMDEFLFIFPESTYDLIKREQRHHENWRNIRRCERFNIFYNLRSNREIPAGLDFEQFNEFMRVDLSRLDAIEVNYNAIPFGNDNTPTGIYRREHGRRFYVGIQEWPFSNINFAYLTTESLMTEIVESIYDQKYTDYNPLVRVELDHVPGIYPISVPLYIDKRAAADRKVPKVSELAAEIIASDPNAFVISNGVKDVDRVITFQKAKGQNDLREKNVFVIVNNFAPEQYARLNIIGQWLGIPNIISLYYGDQINQAVGRNRGFRESPNRDTRTVIITSNRLYKNVIQNIDSNGGTTRVRMLKTAQNPF